MLSTKYIIQVLNMFMLLKINKASEANLNVNINFLQISLGTYLNYNLYLGYERNVYASSKTYEAVNVRHFQSFTI